MQEHHDFILVLAGLKQAVREDRAHSRTPGSLHNGEHRTYRDGRFPTKAQIDEAWRHAENVLRYGIENVTGHNDQDPYPEGRSEVEDTRTRSWIVAVSLLKTRMKRIRLARQEELACQARRIFHL